MIIAECRKCHMNYPIEIRDGVPVNKACPRCRDPNKELVTMCYAEYNRRLKIRIAGVAVCTGIFIPVLTSIYMLRFDPQIFALCIPAGMLIGGLYALLREQESMSMIRKCKKEE